MIVFNADKPKDVAMIIETSNIEDDQLKFMFIIEVDDVQYGFKCKMSEDKVKIHVPVLNDVIKDLKAGEYRAFLQVTGNKNYLLKPFNEQVKIVTKPKIDVLLSQDDEDPDEIKEELELSISKILDDDDIKDEIKEDKTVKGTKGAKKSKMSKFLE